MEEQEETETEYRELAESSFTKPTVKETVKVTSKLKGVFDNLAKDERSFKLIYKIDLQNLQLLIIH